MGLSSITAGGTEQGIDGDKGKVQFGKDKVENIPFEGFC